MAGPDLVQVTSPSGVRLTVAKDAAEAFTGFLSDLEGQGYKIDQQQSGGYANRNIAGTDTPSQHSFGHAVDINWNWNPRGANAGSDLPSNVGELAAKHGLTWGGNWSGDTRDPMHFEYTPGRSTKVAVDHDAVWNSLGNKTATPDNGATPAAPEIDHDAVFSSLGAKNVPTPAPTSRYGPQAQDWGIPMPSVPEGAPGPPAAPPASTGRGVLDYLGQTGLNALQEIKTGMQGFLTPEAQKAVEGVPVVGPVLGEASRLIGGALAVPAAAFHALQSGVATGSSLLIPPNAGGSIGPSLAAGLEVLPAANMPGFRHPMDVRGGADYATSRAQDVLNNRSVTLPSDFRAQPFAPDAAARVAAGAVSGPTEGTGVPPPPPGGIPGAPTPRPRLTVGPEPESVGAMATPAGAIPDPTRAQALSNLEKAVNQSAEDRAGPQQVDQTAYVPGIPTRPLASRVFNAQNALDEKALRAKDVDPGAGRDQLEAIDRDRNQGMVDLLRRDAGDANTLDKARAYRREAAPEQFGAFQGEQPVDASGLLKVVDDAMNDARAAKSKSITAALQEVRDTLHDKDGNLETLPSQIYGARQNLTDLLDRSKGTGDEAKKLQAATAILTKMVPDFDEAIGGGAPRYQLYMDEYRKRSQEVNQQEFLQKYTEGTAGNKITDATGYLQQTRVQKLLNDILQEQKRAGTSNAKSLTDDQIQNIINVRNELGAAQLRDRRASVKGSDTFQQLSREAEKGSGVLGTALRAGGSLAGQALALHVAGLDPTLNALGMIGRGVLTPTLEAARAKSREATRAAASEARKQELLRQGPGNPLIQP